MKMRTSVTFDGDLISAIRERQRLCGAAREKAGEKHKPHEMPILLGWCNFWLRPNQYGSFAYVCSLPFIKKKKKRPNEALTKLHTKHGTHTQIESRAPQCVWADREQRKWQTCVYTHLKKKSRHPSDNIEHIISEKPLEDRNLVQICFRCQALTNKLWKMHTTTAVAFDLSNSQN